MGRKKSEKTVAVKKNPVFEKPVYIIDAYKNFKRFEDVEEAGRILSLSKKQIVKCANGDADTVGGFISAFADCVEDIGRNGEKIPDTFIINLAAESLAECSLTRMPNLNQLTADKSKLQIQKGEIPTIKAIPPEDYNHLRQDQLNNPFYVMNENYEYGKYFSKAHVGKHIGITTSTVLKCVLGTNKIVKGYTMAPASEIETESEDGTITLNLDILMKRFEKPDYFYAINENGKCKKFETTIAAAKALKLSSSGIIRCLLGVQKICGKYVFVKRNVIEKENEKGKIEIDTQKIEELKKLLIEEPFYIIDPKTKEATPYADKKKAAEAVQCTLQQLGECLKGRNKSVKGKIAVYASEIERQDAEGTTRISEDRVEEIIKAATTISRLDVSKEGFYVIKKDSCEKYFSIEKAAKDLEIDPSAISMCLKGSGLTAGGAAFAMPDEIEIKDEDGNIISTNEAKIEEKRAVFDRYAVYAVRRGFCKRYDGYTEAGKDLGLKGEYISDCIAGRKKSTGHTAFLPASAVEKRNPEGKIEINEQVLLDAIKELTKHEVYAFKADGSFEKFQDRTSAASKYGISTDIIRAYSNRKRKSPYEGIIFIAAKDIEIANEDWTVSLDKKKLKEKLAPFRQKKDYPTEIVINTLLLQLALIKKPEIGAGQKQ